jgi:glycosyltransferase involved in cell wall biosynthesis
MPNLDGGGAERVIVNIIKQLEKDKYEIYLVLVKAKGDYIDLIPKNVKIIDLKSKRILYSLFKLRNVIKDINPEILFSSLFDTNILLYLASFGLLKKKKLIMRSPNSPKLVIENNSLSKLKRFLLEKAYQKANLIIAQTPEMKEEINKFHSIKKEKIEVFLNPLDTELIDFKISNITNPFNSNFINVVAVGRLNRQKGFDILIKSFKDIVTNNKNFVLHILGKDKGEEKNLKNLVADLNLSDNIIFHGFQENPYKFYYFSDLYVLSSRWEGLPNTVLENLYLKKPIVATNCIPFMDKLIQDGENGFLVDVENIEQLTKAILDYKKIKPKEFSNESNINNLLNKIIKDKELNNE